ncbi:MAG: hypothetical protein VCF24_09530 [Candidatus Latescibacterota bacterium]
MPGLPGRPQRHVDALGTPHGEHAQGVAAAHEDQVLVTQKLRDVGHGAFKQEQVSDPRPLRWEPVLEVARHVTGGGSQDADADPWFARGIEHVIDEGMHAAAGMSQPAEGDDVACAGIGLHWGRSVL